MSGQASSPPRTDIPDVVVSPEAFLAMGREVLASQPFSILVGARLHALSQGTASCICPSRPSCCNSMVLCTGAC